MHPSGCGGSGGRVVEGARLESEYTAKPYRGFESLPLRHLVNLLLLLNFMVQIFGRKLPLLDLIRELREAWYRRNLSSESHFSPNSNWEVRSALDQLQP